MEQDKRSDLIEKFDTGELSKDIIPPNFTDPDVLFEVLTKLLTAENRQDEMGIIRKAYELAKEAHKDQKRKSGEPYLIHPVCVAIILTQLDMDKETIVGGLLHDVIEDTPYTVEDITQMFSAEIALLVDGVTKLTQLNYSADKLDVQAENLRKMFLAMAKDIRVIIIKLADRLHNMRTLQFMKPEKQKEKARETMDIYAPIAHRLGISKVKVELDDLSLQYLEPEAYKELNDKFNHLRVQKETFVKDIMEDVKEHLDEAKIKATIDGRVKHLFSIYRKMVNQNKTLDQIYDLFAIRIIVDTEQQCYTALGIIHEMYKPIPGRFKDYIAMPKPNHYQSLHTTLIGPNGAGKSTILKTIAKQLQEICGSVYVENTRLCELPEKELAKKMSIVFTERITPELMTVADVVAMGRYPYTGGLGILTPKDEAVVAQCMEQTRISPLKERNFMSLSDGQKQRVLLAKALCQEPEILILDEPTSYLDVKYKLEFLSMLQEMTRKKKIGVLMSLHELDLAERVSDKIVCVKGKNIEHYGTPEEVFTDGFVDQLYEITDGTFQEKNGCVELKKCDGIPEVFVIAGNGTGSFLFRQLQRNGIPFAVGILGKNDIDYPAAEALAVQVIAAEAYQDFERQHYEAAKQVMCACRKVICCQTVFGSQNVLNRQLLQEAEDCGMEIELWQK